MLSVQVALEIIRPLLAGETVTFRGTHCRRKELGTVRPTRPVTQVRAQTGRKCPGLPATFGGMTTRRSFRHDRAAVGDARRFVSELLEDRHHDVIDAAVLLTSEVVSNAIVHGRSGPTVAVQLAPDRVRVEVSDASPVLPVRKHYGLEATTGRGLMLLETIATAWGVEPLESGKRVWFDLEVATAADVAAGPAVTAADVMSTDLDALAASFGEIEPDAGSDPVAEACRPAAAPADVPAPVRGTARTARSARHRTKVGR